MIKALLVGGDPGYSVYQRLKEKLSLHFGIRVKWHWTKKPRSVAPKGCQLVLVSADMTGHGISQRANDVAKAAGIPVVAIDRSWTRTYGALVSRGYEYTVMEPSEVVPSLDVPPLKERDYPACDLCSGQLSHPDATGHCDACAARIRQQRLAAKARQEEAMIETPVEEWDGDARCPEEREGPSLKKMLLDLLVKMRGEGVRSIVITDDGSVETERVVVETKNFTLEAGS